MSDETVVTDFQKVVVHCLKEAGQIPPALLLEELGNRLLALDNEDLQEVGRICHDIVGEGQDAFAHFIHELTTAPKLLVPK